jgi:hypothetical protein
MNTAATATTMLPLATRQIETLREMIETLEDVPCSPSRDELVHALGSAEAAARRLDIEVNAPPKHDAGERQ